MRILGLPVPLILGAAMALPLLSQPARWEVLPRDSFQHLSLALLSDQVLAVAVDSNSATWIGTTKGVTRFLNGQSIHFTTWDVLPDSEIRAIAVDRQNVKWFATRRGVSSFDDKNWISIDETGGLVSNVITSIAVGPDDAKWFGTPAGLSRFDGSTWASFTLEAGDLPSNTVNQVAIGPDGGVWVATSRGVAHYDGAEWQEHSRRDGLASDYVTSIAVDRHGLVWCGTDEGLSVFDGADWYGFVEEGREPPAGRERHPRLELVTAVLIDPANEAWIVTRVNCGEYAGAALRLFHYDHEALRERFATACTWDQLAASLAVDERGRLLIGLSGEPSHSGVFRSGSAVDHSAEPVPFEMEKHWFWPTPGNSEHVPSRVLLDDIRAAEGGGLTLERKADGGFLLSVGRQLVVSTDTDGDTLWTRTFQDESVVGLQDSPGHCCTVLAEAPRSGTGPSWKLYRLDQSGEVLWERRLQVPPSMEEARSWRPFTAGLASLGNEEYLVATSTKGEDECCSWWENWQVILGFFDASGTVVSDAVVQGTPYWSNPRNRNSIIGRGLLSGHGSEVVIYGREYLGLESGHSYLEDREAPFVKAIGADGSDIWYFRSPLTELSSGLGPSAKTIRASGSQYLFMANAGFDDREIPEYNRLLLAMLDSRGNVVWERILARSGVHTVGLDLAPHSGGGSILLGTFEYSLPSRRPGPRQAGDELWMCQLDAEGRVVRSWSLGQNADGYDLRIATSPEGALRIFGYHADDGVLDVREVTGARTDVERDLFNGALPRRMELHPNYPNPFNSSTTISFSIADEGLVSLRVFNLYGALVSELTNTVLPAGRHAIAFDSGNLASGLYFCKLESKGRTLSRKMILLR